MDSGKCTQNGEPKMIINMDTNTTFPNGVSKMEQEEKKKTCN